MLLGTDYVKPCVGTPTRTEHSAHVLKRVNGVNPKRSDEKALKGANEALGWQQFVSNFPWHVQESHQSCADIFHKETDIADVA